MANRKFHQNQSKNLYVLKWTDCQRQLRAFTGISAASEPKNSLTHSTQQNPSCGYSVNQKISCILQNPKIHSHL